MSSSPSSFKNEGDPSAASFVSFPCLSKQLRLQIAHALNAMSLNALLSIALVQLSSVKNLIPKRRRNKPTQP
jgi:hypothetical protein